MRFGPNELVPAARSGGLASLAIRVLTDPMSILLVVAGGTYLALGDRVDAAITLAALVPIAAVTVVLELRAERALEALRTLAAPKARVIRDGGEKLLAALDLVPGDVIVVHEGDIVPADSRLFDGASLQVDESSLTGESGPVAKSHLVADDAALYAGTTVLTGRARAAVTATGRATRYGAIGLLLATITPAPTPLQTLIRRLVVQLSLVASVFCVAVVMLELARGAPLEAAIIAGVSLAMAAIPEEFPMVFTLYLGLGAWRLARDRALVRRLVGVETLGATSVICADKTGTLTLGTIEVAELWPAPGASERDLLRAAVLASEPRPYDPLEQAILARALAAGVDVEGLHAAELVRDHPFDPIERYLTHVWRIQEAIGVFAKGAIEGLLARGATPPLVREEALRVNLDLAARGRRVIAVASAEPIGATGGREDDERALRLVGLVAFTDPLRPGVAEAIAECRAAGIRVIVITGDHPVTAQAVANGLGLDGGRVATGEDVDAANDESLARLLSEVGVFARVRPEQKHRIVRALRAQGHVVAMTGDGTNDAPALREADVGIAMGRRGTEVARSAATLVLLDDNFATIVAAVRDGRRIFENLRRAFGYLVSFHVPLLGAALAVPLVGAPLLLLPVHLVWLELVVHPTASLVFEGDPASPDLMRRPPRGRATVLLERGALAALLARGGALTVGVLALYLLGLASGMSENEARGTAIAALVLGQVLLVLVERAGRHALWRVGLSDNAALPWVCGGTLGSLVLVEYVPVLATLLHLAPPTGERWALALAVAALTTLWGEPAKALRPAGARSSGE